MAIHLSDSVAKLPGIGPKAYQSFKNMGIISIRDLLCYTPFRYDDFSIIKKIKDITLQEPVTINVEVESMESRRSFKRKRLSLTEGVVKDETGELHVTWFNQPYLAQSLKPGTKIALAGKVEIRKGVGRTMVNPVQEPQGKQVHTGRIVPVYGLSGSLSMRKLRGAIKHALQAAHELIEWIPQEILEKENWPGFIEATTQIHFPDSRKQLTLAIKRLKFDELFLHQLMFAAVREERKIRPANAFKLKEDHLKTFAKNLPFELTNAQKQAAWELVQDVAKDRPMNRLLEGDVGSGKTVVAAMASSMVLSQKGVVAYLAPTEILAIQQQASFQQMMKNEWIGLLTQGSCKMGAKEVKREELFEQMENGEVRCVIGTHALIQQGVPWKEIDFVIIDEQHRFGVEQRHALLEQGAYAPHLLSMTATPIPRSLALTLYGDLDLSIINQMPVGRKPVATALVAQKEQGGMWGHVREMISTGGQVFVVCPLIDPSDKLGSKSVTETVSELKKGALKGQKIAALHGKMKPDEKAKIIREFREGKIEVLVSTTVVEVGVDIPNATVMVILGAERFGLAQLHQLRGRVGRGGKQAYCYLLPDTTSEKSTNRLQAMCETNNGFELAERDLELRGPGNVFGNAQSGFPDFKLATPADVALMKKARDWSQDFLENDPNLEQSPLLKQKVTEAFDVVHLE